MKKEEIILLLLTPIPDIRIRVIDFGDSDKLKKHKKKYPFKLYNSITVCVGTDRRTFQFPISNDFFWNGADIPRIFWLLIGSRTDNDFLIASMVHDFLLRRKEFMMREILKHSMLANEYRRLTSIIFREILLKDGTHPIKANIMSFCVDTFQRCKRYFVYILKFVKKVKYRKNKQHG